MNFLGSILFTFLFIFAGCKPSDFNLSAPKASTNGITKVNFDHNMFQKVSCVQCHENKRPLTSPPHGNGADCIGCHTPALNSMGVRAWINLSNFNHSPMPATCITCHENKRPLSVAPHLAGQWGNKQDCATCHTYPSWKPAQFDHIKPLTSCIECHRTPTKDDRPQPVTSHPSAFYNKIDCIQCHTNSNNSKKWGDLIFNHRTHLPAPTSCMTCHEIKRPTTHKVLPTKIAGMDKSDCKSCHTSSADWTQVSAFDHEVVKPTSCVGCHATNTPANQTVHPSAVGNYSKIDCIKCHTYDKTTSARSWAKIVFNQHTHLPAPVSCLECHKNVNNSLPVSGSHTMDSRSAKDCATCHKFDTVKKWTNYSPFNHIVIGATERCDTCHAPVNKSLTSKIVGHISTTLDCKSCHVSSAWKPATFTHSSTDTNCSTCHNGTIATGKTLTHVATTQQCSSCHTQSAWKPATFKHATTDTNCVSCHNGTTATGRATGHNLPMANLQCSTCHNQTAFKPAVYSTSYNHSANGGLIPNGTSYHKSQSSCTMCHSNTTDNVIFTDTAANAKASIVKCSGCHSTEYNNKISKHKNVSVVTNSNCLKCHSYNGW